MYRSADSLAELIREIEAESKELAESLEVIFVNDGSPDNSWVVVEELSRQYPWVRGISLMRNYGQHNALLCGIRAARYEFIATVDDDLQHRAQDIAVLLGKLKEGYDVVYGPPLQEQHSIWRNLASQCTKIALQSSMGVSVARQVSAFRVFRTKLREGFADYQGPYVSIDVLLSWTTTRFAAVGVPHRPRQYGDSNYTLRKLLRHALNMITGFSSLPLRIASISGLAFSIFGGVLLIYVLGRYLLHGTTVAGFPFLASVIAIFSGVQLFSLGIIGEYIARIHFRTMDRPTYAVREATPK